jgi:hypothetical protein
MKFLLIVLAIHLAAELVSGKKNKGDRPDTEKNRTTHPAEFGLRDN